MSSTFVADTTDDSSSAGNTLIIIVDNDTGDISVDQETLQLLSSQENTTLSVVRVNDAAGDSSTDVNITVEEDFNPVSSPVLEENEEELMETDQEIAQVNGNVKAGPKISEQVLETTDPLLALDQEEIEKIEHALQAEAGAFFNNILPPEAGLDDLLDPELTGAPDDTEAVASISLDHCYSAAHGPAISNSRNADSAMSSEVDSSDSVSTGIGGGSGSTRQPSPKRRSQRQIDRQEMEQLKKIRAENEELLKKEKEEMNQIQQVNTPKKEAEAEPEETLFVAIPEPVAVAPEETPPPAPAQPLSRLAVIRQKLQQDILSVDPVKAKVHTPSSNQPVKTPLPKTQPLAKTPQTTPAKTPPTLVVQTKSSPVTAVKSPQSVQANPVQTAPTPQSPQKSFDFDRQSPVSRVSSSGGVARPRRENRQPPKHLREAFNQLEFEGIERLVKKTSTTKGLSSPDEQPIKTEDDPLAEEKPDDPVVPSPKKMDEKSKDGEEEQDPEDLDDVDDDPSGEGSDSDENEDDPDRLWCVCREPHNNRFMICCDKCEEWFHGTCVGITRSMGRELELKKLEWICPKCVRQEYADTQEPFVHLQDIDFPEKPIPLVEEKSPVKSVEKTAPPRSTDPVKAANEKAKLKAQMTQRRVRVSSSGSGTAEEATAVPLRCIVAGCKNDARANSIYCSDACIVSHVRDSLIAMSKEKIKQTQLPEPPSPSTPVTPTSSGASKWKESVEFGQLMSQPTPVLTSKSKAINQLRKSISSEGASKPANLADDTPVPVLERKTGKILSGSAAPKVANLEVWLKDNPTFEVIKPATLPNNKPRLSISTTPVASSILLNAKSASPATPTSLTSQAPSPSSSSSLPRIRADSNSSKKLGESKSKVFRKRSIETSKDEETSKKVVVQSDPESTRARSRSSLKETLWNRCKEATDLETDEQAVEQVATEVEEALYRLFNKDVGTKYKNKYRTLIFNIKDPKNLGLFRKIIEKQITPGQLVKMSTEELASKELAEWREQEAKHQLDIIQKTELELMTMSNKYLVKTHKGEEIIEEAGKELDERESATSTTTTVPAPLLEALQDTTSKHKSHLFDLNCQICSGKIKEEEADKDKSSNSSSSTSIRKRSEKSSKQSSHHSESSSKRSDKDRRDHDRKKKDHDKERSHHRPSRSKDRHHRHRSDRDKERDKEKKKEEVKKEEAKKEDGKKEEIKKEEAKKEEAKKEEKLPAPEAAKEESETKEESVVKEDITASIDESEALPVENADEPVTVVQPVQEKNKEPMEEEPSSKQEPTSTVSIKTPEQQSFSPEMGPVVWKGVINSAETGKVNVQALDMSGSTDLADLEMPSSLDIVGRIRPEMVWEYVNQTRRAGTRDIVVFKFTPASDSDRKHYSSFLSHMYKHNRFAVVGTVSKLIKDFYVVPLPKDSPIPLALVSLSSGTKSLDENRTSSLLLGVVVRARKKRAVDQIGNGGAAVPHKAAKLAKMSAKTTPPSNASSDSPSLNYIPTSRANSKMAGKSDPPVRASKAETTSNSSQMQADDAPYSPGQLLVEDEEPVPVVVDEELLKQQAMLEELNRQIEAQKQELATMSAEVASTTSSEMMIPGLGEPVIPGLGEPSTSSTSGWASIDTRVTPSTDPPFDHSAKAAPASLNNLNISNLQEIISTIQKKEMEMKMSSKTTEDRSLPTELFSPHDVDMRIAGPIPVQPVAPVQPVIPIGVVPVATPAPEKKKPSLLNQLTDEQLLAKAMEMEMEQAGIPAAPMAGQQFFPPPRGAIPYPPMGPGMPSGPPMMGHPRPFHPPPFMGGRPPFHAPPGSGFRPRPNKKKR